MTTGSPAEIEYLRTLAQRLTDAGHGERGPIIEAARRRLGCSIQALYAKLRGVGWNSGRKLRQDKGASAVPADEVKLVAALMQASRRQNGKRMMDVRTAIDIARANDQFTTECSATTVLRAMRRQGMHPDQLDQSTPYTTMRSEFPNQVWQIDASVCVLYYLRGGQLGVMDETEFYKNKPQNVERVADRRVIRYLQTDHYTGAFFARYYNVTGENAQTFSDFLIEAMQARDGFVMHGAPFNLIMDQGAANIAHTSKCLLNALSVRHWPHKTKNSRAKGQVESSHNWLERKFESRLAFMSIEAIEQLNAALDEWQRDYNATEEHSRHGFTRWSLWQTVKPDQLRVCPPVDVCQQLLFAKPEPRTVKGNLTIQFAPKGYESAFYSLAHIPTVRVGDEVLVTVNAYRLPEIYVIGEDETGATRYYSCEPVARDRAGFPLDAPVFGQSYRAPADRDVDEARKDLREMAYGTRDPNEADSAKRKGAVAMSGAIDPMKDIRDRAAGLPDHMARPGTAMHVPTPIQMPERPLSHIDALLELRARIGRALSVQEAAAVRGWYPDGVPETDLDVVVARLIEPTPAERPRLVAIK